MRTRALKGVSDAGFMKYDGERMSRDDEEYKCAHPVNQNDFSVRVGVKRTKALHGTSEPDMHC